ncbi:unnamed protein product [Urochloa humidicola]
MAGSLSHALWPRSDGRSSSRRESTTPARGIAAQTPSEREAWRSPTVDQRVGSFGAPVPSPLLRSSSPSSIFGRHASRVVHFATPAICHASSSIPPRRPWRTATPFPTTYAAATQGSSLTSSDTAEVHMPTVDMEPSRRLAYAFVHPPCADPGNFIRVALERHGGDPPVRLAASSYGTMMVVFGHPHFRETVLRRGPIELDGHTLRMERHEESQFRVDCPYGCLVELAATQFPPEHWTEPGIHTAFQVFGQVCSIARSTLREVDNRRDYGIADYFVVRVLVLVDVNRRITSSLLVRNPNGVIAGIAELRVVGDWAHPPGSPTPDDHQFEFDDEGPPCADRTTPRPPR